MPWPIRLFLIVGAHFNVREAVEPQGPLASVNIGNIRGRRGGALSLEALRELPVGDRLRAFILARARRDHRDDARGRL